MPSSSDLTPSEQSRLSGAGHTRNHIVLNVERLRQRGMVVPDAQRSNVKEEFRHIKQPLLMNIAGQGTIPKDRANLIMVTSASNGEGKSYTALNLALSIATERDKTVLLIDADVVRPSVAPFLGIKTTQGLVDYLINEQLTLPELLVRTDLPNFSILPAGHPHHLSTELLASVSMQQLVHELATRYPDRVIIFDSPPLLMTSEARVLANLMGQIVFVVEARRTTKARIDKALDLLHLNKDTAIGFVLNKTAEHEDMTYYAYAAH